jgi:23S rRNA pseudouridine1911/1915/1917 synthase
MNSRILYQSAACIVVNKQKGESVENSKGGIVNLQEELSSLLPEAKLIEAVHRLDVPVTGCALFALTKDALSFLGGAFAAEDSPIEKLYWAIIEKPLFNLPEKGELTHWIETDTGKNKSFAYGEEKKGRKKAVLRYKTAGEGTNYLFLEINLLTGRHHQIRAQLAAEGLHIKGDLKYGAKRSEKDGGIRLHARSLSFPDPLNKTEKIKVSAPLLLKDNLWMSFEKERTRRHGDTGEE